MMSAIEQNLRELDHLCQKHEIRYLGIFGSYAREESHTGSDLDLLVEFKHRKSAFQLLQVKRELETLLGHPVDLVMRKYLDPYIKPYILRDLQTIIDEKAA